MIPIHYNATACDRNFHKKVDIDQDIDVSVIGIAEHPRFGDHHMRIKVVDMLRDNGIRVAAFGNKWPEHPDNHGSIEGEKFREIICRSKLGVDVQDVSSPMAHRMLEYGACGIPVITRHRPEVFRLFTEDKEILTYHSDQELPDIVKKYLNDSTARELLAERLYQRCRKSHDISNRVDGLLKFLKGIDING